MLNQENVPNNANEERVTLVCVTDQFRCERIIKAGRIISDLTKTKLEIISVVNSEYPQNPEALDYLYRISSINQGIMNIEYSSSPLRTITKYIKQNKIANVITGTPTTENSLTYSIWTKFSHITFFTVDEDGEIREAKADCKVGQVER